MKDKRKQIIGKYLAALGTALFLLSGCAVGAPKGGEDLEGVDLTKEEDFSKAEERKKPKEKLQEEEEQKVKEELSEEIFVHVCGSVVSPGVYRLPRGARVFEAIQAAGGSLEDAAGETINQAGEVADGERVYVPSKEEAEAGILSGQPAGAGGNENASSKDGKVNLNTAGKEELMTLPGIGESKAESILSFREANGGFQSIEQLKEIEGIKEGVFNKVKDRITV